MRDMGVRSGVLVEHGIVVLCLKERGYERNVVGRLTVCRVGMVTGVVEINRGGGGGGVGGGGGGGVVFFFFFQAEDGIRDC